METTRSRPRTTRTGRSETLFAPFDVVLVDDTLIQPDLIVAPDAADTARDLATAPLLVVEVLSPSTRSLDLLLTRERLRRAGCPHSWVVDVPEASGPAVTAWRWSGWVLRPTTRPSPRLVTTRS